MHCKLVFLFSMPVDFQHQGNISFGMVFLHIRNLPFPEVYYERKLDGFLDPEI